MKTLLILLNAGLTLCYAIRAQQPSFNFEKSKDTSIHERCDTGLVTDIDGNIYKTVRIGDQTWMSENLRSTKYNDGSLISLIEDGVLWGSLSTPAYCWYNNDIRNKVTYGALYNYYVMDTKNICPVSWHVPNDTEWTTLINYLGGELVAGSKLKEIGTTHWESPNTDATNETGFTALPGGHRDLLGNFGNMKLDGLYWSSTEEDFTDGWSRFMTYNTTRVWISLGNKKLGFSVRCIKDSDEQVNLTNGLVAHYPFNGNAKDESGNGYNGVVHGATLTNDRYGNNHSSYSFDTNNATIQLPNAALNDLPNASISLWVYWKGERPSIIMAKQHDWVDSYYIFGIGMYNVGGGVDIGDAGRVYFKVKNNSPSLFSNSLLESNKWNHLAITIDQDLKLYINGILDTAISGSDFVLPDDLDATLTSLGIWLQDIRYSGVMNGNLDDIRFYNRALNNLEIQSLYNENKVVIYTPKLNVSKNNSFVIPINANNLISTNNGISYQFDFNFDSQKLQFLNYDIANTLSQNGSIQISPSENKLSIAWAGQTSLADSGILIKLQFKALETGTTIPALSKFLINTDTIKNITNGTVTINPSYGDVDSNGHIQAYDAALALQYSVGLDPLPDIDPLPWEDWRITLTNVDGENDISAYDASLILQYTVGLIHSFPVQGHLKSTSVSHADVSVEIENGNMVFRSSGDFKGLNVNIVGNPELFGSPHASDAGALLSKNYSSSGISIGLAMANTPPEDEIILTIPVIGVPDQPLILSLLVNNQGKQMDLGMLTGLSETFQKSIEIYPNPANTILYFKNLPKNVSISIFDLQGRKIRSCILAENQIDISDLAFGLYTVQIESNNKTLIKKLIKK